MGYELHITRARFWAENEGSEISQDEWRALVDSDPDLTIDVRNGPFFAVLISQSEETPGWLDWSDGNISTKNPNRDLLAKMLQIADTLEAAVQGDDGELYRSADEIPERPAGRDHAPARFPWLPGYTRSDQLKNLAIYVLIALVIAAINVFDLW